MLGPLRDGGLRGANHAQPRERRYGADSYSCRLTKESSIVTDGNERAYEGVDEAEAVAAAKKSADPTTRSVYRDGKELSRVIRLRPAATIHALGTDVHALSIHSAR
jgi:hypothetical protein